MKRPANIFRNFLFPLLTTIVITACTIMDNDLRDLPDNPAFREIVHEEGEGYTADYQYQPWTILVDDSYENYIYSMDYINAVLYLYDYIPENLLPKEGNSIAAKPSDKLEWGLSYKVDKIIRDGSYYAVIMQRAELLDIFKYIEYNQEDSFKIQENTLAEIDTTQSSYVLTRAERRAEKIPYDKPNDPYWTETVNDMGTWKLDLIKVLGTIAAKKNFGTSGQKLAAAAMGLTGAIIDQTLDGDLGTIHNIRWSSSGDDRTSKEMVTDLLTNKINKQFGGVEAINAANNNSENDHVLAARTERNKRELLYKTNLWGSFSLDIDGWIQCLVSLTPTLKTKNYVYANEKDKNAGKTDVAFEICGDFGFSFLLGGKITSNIDILYLIEHLTGKQRPQIAKVIAAPAGIPVWVQMKPLLNWLTSVEGRVGYNGHKYFSIGCGYRKNIKNHKDGFYKINNTTELEWNERKKWTAVSGFSSKVAFETQIKFVPQAVLGIGIPGVDFLNAVTKGTSEKLAPFLSDLKGGVNITLEYDPSIAAGFKAERDESMHGQTHLHLGFPVSWKDLLFVFRPWPGWEFPINFGDYLCDWLGKNGTKEFFPKDWYWYPVLTLGATCTNPDYNGAPEFHLEFVVDDLGINYSEKEPSTPLLKIFKAGQENGDPMYAEFYPSLKSGDTRKHFELELHNDMLWSGTLKRGEIYNARLELHDDDGNLQCYTDNYFTSITPSAYISKDKLLAWEGKYPTQTNYSTVYKTEPTDRSPSECTFIFNTTVELENYNQIKQVGFYVGSENKRYVCESKVASSILNAIWEMKTKQTHYILSIRPFVTWVDKYGRTIENIWPAPHKVDYNYQDKNQCPRDPNWGGEGKAYKKYPEDIGIVTTYATHYTYGNDTRTDAQKSSVVAKEKSDGARRRTGIYVGEENNVPTYMFTIEPEDLE